MLRGSYEVLGELKGAEMEGWTYDGPFDELPAEQEIGGHTVLKEIGPRCPPERRPGTSSDPMG